MARTSVVHPVSVQHRTDSGAWRRPVGLMVGVVLVLFGTMVWPGSAPSNAATVPAIVPLVPARLLETRSGPDVSTIDGDGLGAGRVAAGNTVSVRIANRHGIPGNATAAMLNVTAVFPSGPGFLTVFPCGAERPGTSSVNYGAGKVVANAALAKLGVGGEVCIYTLTETDIVVDVTAYVPDGGSVNPIVPGRLLETRTGPDAQTVDGQGLPGQRPAAGATVEVKVTDRHGIPADASSVILNLTAVFPEGPGFLTAYPCGQDRPTTSSVNYGAGQVVANTALAKVGADGKVCIYTLVATDILADVTAYAPNGSTLYTLTPGRLLDTRPGADAPTVDGQDKGGGIVVADSTVAVTVTGRHGIPSDATAVMLNVTAVFPDRPGFLTVYPCGEARPTTSTVNYGAGEVVPNAALSKVGADGKVCIYSLGTTHVIADVSGFVPGASGQGPTTTLPGGGTTTTTITTTTPPPDGGLTAWLRPGFDDQRLAVGPDGTTHLAFYDGYAAHAWYGQCTDACHLEASWQLLLIADVSEFQNTVIGVGGLDVDDSGRVHMLLDGVPMSGETGMEMMYATCAAACTSGANWQRTDLTPSVGNTNTITTNDTFMVTDGGKVAILTSGSGGADDYWFECATTCTNLANWSGGGLFNSSVLPLNAEVDADGTTHLIANVGQTGAGDTVLAYGRCADDCADFANWQFTEDGGSFAGFLINTAPYKSIGTSTLTFELGPDGRVYLGYQQGQLTFANPDQNRFLLNSCTGDACFDLNAWSSVALGAAEEGADGADLFFDAGGADLVTV
ncbi:MAG TPA: hypothetical protein VMM60_18920, partial [Ilumatobacter sp.]|nr:hypothetical protein [Ilumatobacter sp.]